MGRESQVTKRRTPQKITSREGEDKKNLQLLQDGRKKRPISSEDKERSERNGKVSLQRTVGNVVNLARNIGGISPRSRKIGTKLKPQVTESKIGKIKKLFEGAAAVGHVIL